MSLLALGVTTQALAGRRDPSGRRPRRQSPLAPYKGGVNEKIRGVVGLDRFAIEPAYSSTTKTFEPKFIVGKSFGDRASVSMATSVGTSADSTATAEYKLREHIFLQGSWQSATTTQEGDLGADLKFRYRYRRLEGLPSWKGVTPEVLPLLLAAALLLFLRGSAAAADPSAPAASGPVISSVSFQVSSPFLISYEELTGLVKVRPGDRLTREGVRASIRGLYEKSIFREVSAFTRETDGKVDLLFFLRPFPLVAEIEVAGAKRFTPAQIISASRLKRGPPVEEKDLSDAEEAVRAFLPRKGFVRGTASVSVTCNVENGGGKVLVTVAEGEPGTVGNLRFPGATRFTPEEMARFLGAEAGKPHDFRRWEKGLSHLRSEYKRAGFLTVHVSDAVERCEPSSDLLCPAVPVEEGPQYDVRWEGVAAFTPARLAEVAGLRGDEEISEGALVRDLRERLVAFYRGRGYLLFDAAVTVEEPSAGRTPLIVTVVEGKRGYIKEVRFSGNQGLSEKALRGQMTTRGRGVFHWVTNSGQLQRRGVERRHERDRRVVPEVRVRPDEGPGGRQRLGRPGRDRENDPGRGGAAIPAPGNRLRGERPFPPGRIPGAHQEQGGGSTSTTSGRRPIRRRWPRTIATPATWMCAWSRRCSSTRTTPPPCCAS